MKTWLRIVLGTIIIAVVVYLLRGIDFQEVYSLILQANNFYLILAFLSYGLALMTFNLRSVHSLKTVAKTGYWFNLKATFAGNFVNVITPGAQVGGEPVRAYYLGKKYNESFTDLFGAIIADRVFHVLGIAAFIIISLLYVLSEVPISSELKVIFQTVLFIILTLSILALVINSDKARNKIIKIVKKRGWTNSKKGKAGEKGKIRKLITKHSKVFLESFIKTLKDRKTITIGVFLSLIHWIFFYFTSYFLFLSFDINLSFLIILVVTSLGSAIGDLSPTPGGLGVVEGSMIFMYSAFGIAFPVAFAVSVLSRIIIYFFHLVVGGISLLQLEKEFG